MSKKSSAYRSFNPLSLSFLDIMSCGLGAVILIFLILRHGESISPEATKLLEGDIKNTEISLARISEEISSSQNKVANLNSQIVLKDKEIKTSRLNLRIEKENVSKLVEQGEEIIKSSKAIEEATPDIVEKISDGERQYLTGLKIEGKRIVYLLDNSASMLHENTQLVFKLSLSSEEEKVKARKWVRAKETLKWLTARLPKNSNFTIMTYNKDVKSHTNNSWLDSEDPLSVNSALESALNEIPENGTNLERALQAIKKMFPLPDSVYIITDGLPTLGEPVKKLGILLETRNCLKPRGKITSECRHIIFQKAKGNYLSGNKIKTSTILFPLQGDLRAASDYWNLAIQSGGTTISPSRDWP